MTFNKKLFFPLLLILFFSIITNQAYAESTSDDAVSWQIIFISDNPDCKISEKTRINEIIDLTQQYFDLYKLGTQMLEPVCVFSLQYFENS